MINIKSQIPNNCFCLLRSYLCNLRSLWLILFSFSASLCPLWLILPVRKFVHHVRKPHDQYSLALRAHNGKLISCDGRRSASSTRCMYFSNIAFSFMSCETMQSLGRISL